MLAPFFHGLAGKTDRTANGRAIREEAKSIDARRPEKFTIHFPGFVERLRISVLRKIFQFPSIPSHF